MHCDEITNQEVLRKADIIAKLPMMLVYNNTKIREECILYMSNLITKGPAMAGLIAEQTAALNNVLLYLTDHSSTITKEACFCIGNCLKYFEPYQAQFLLENGAERLTLNLSLAEVEFSSIVIDATVCLIKQAIALGVDMQ